MSRTTRKKTATPARRTKKLLPLEDALSISSGSKLVDSEEVFDSITMIEDIEIKDIYWAYRVYKQAGIAHEYLPKTAGLHKVWIVGSNMPPEWLNVPKFIQKARAIYEEGGVSPKKYKKQARDEANKLPVRKGKRSKKE